MSQYASGDVVCHDDGIYIVFGTAPNLSSEQSALTKEKQGRALRQPTYARPCLEGRNKTQYRPRLQSAADNTRGKNGVDLSRIVVGTDGAAVR